MRAFTGQLTTHGGHGCAAIVWSIPPFYIKVFFTLRDRAIGFFQGIVE